MSSFITSQSDYYVSMENQKKVNLFMKLMDLLKQIPKLSYVFMCTSITLFICQALHVISNIIYNISFDHSYSSLVFNSSILLWTAFVVYLCFDCILSENEFQLFAVLFSVVFMTLSTITNGFFKSVDIIKSWVSKTHGRDTTASILVEIVVVISTLGVVLCSLFLTCLSRPVYKSFGWRIFKYAGGNRKAVRYFKLYLTFKTVLKLDIGMSLTMWYLSFMFIPRGEGGKEPWELALMYSTLFIGFLITMLTYPLFVLSVRYELFIVHTLVIVSNCLLPIYYAVTYIVALVVLPNIRVDGFGNPFYFDCNVKDDKCNYGIDQSFTYVIVGLATVSAILFKLVMFSLAVLLMCNWQKGFKYTLRKGNSATRATAIFRMNEFEKVLAIGRKEKAKQRRKKRSKSTSIPEAQDIDDDDSFFDEDEEDDDSLFNDVDL